MVPGCVATDHAACNRLLDSLPGLPNAQEAGLQCTPVSKIGLGLEEMELTSGSSNVSSSWGASVSYH